MILLPKLLKKETDVKKQVVIRLFNLNLNRNLSYKLKNLTYENITLS